MQNSRYYQGILRLLLGLLVLGQYACSHAAGPLYPPAGTKAVLYVDEQGHLQAVTLENKPFEQCAPCPTKAVVKGKSCSVETVGKLPVCPSLSNVTVTDVNPVSILHSVGSCYWTFVFSNGYFYSGYVGDTCPH
jgi:hypothetical protein